MGRGRLDTITGRLRAYPTRMDTMEPDDELKVAFPQPVDGPTPAELSTGNPEDDQLLRQIASRGSLDVPRPWRHYLYAPDEDTAQVIARPLVATSWKVAIGESEYHSGATGNSEPLDYRPID